MVGHSIVMDGVGFPYLSRPCFYYMAGHVNKAFSFASVGDASKVVQHAVSKVKLEPVHSIYCMLHVLGRKENDFWWGGPFKMI